MKCRGSVSRGCLPLAFLPEGSAGTIIKPTGNIYKIARFSSKKGILQCFHINPN